ncbi:MAG TPA: SDR family oxidoreductase, partial [Methylomirabilota bacterium]|nr:SDR family oxidoreductase [Methylomirabilota bacterium]
MALLRPAASLASRKLATRLLYTLLRDVSRDRLDSLGEEYFHSVLKPQLRPGAVESLREAVRGGEPIVLVSHGLDHVVRPLAQHFGVKSFLANRLEFREGRATGRLLEPIIRPRGPAAWLTGGSTDGRVARGKLAAQLGLNGLAAGIEAAAQPSARSQSVPERPVVLFSDAARPGQLRVRESLRGKHIMLVGVTGFIGKVWLVHLLEEVPGVGKITLLIRRSRTTPAERRFEKIIEESPAFDTLYERHGRELGAFLRQKVEVVEGDVSLPGLGLDEATRVRLAPTLDVIVNSAGLTDFNPDLREALSSNVDSAANLLAYLRQCDHAALMHLSTCYVIGARDGRVTEELQENYNPAHNPEFDAEKEIRSLREMIGRVEERAG